MNLEEYILTCKNFAHDTEGWGGLTDCKFYTTDGVGYWDENCDNDHGGLDVSWAFHRTDEEIENDAKWRYDFELEQELSDALDDRDFDLHQWHATFERYSMPMPETAKACRAAAAVEIARIEADEIAAEKARAEEAARWEAENPFFEIVIESQGMPAKLRVFEKPNMYGQLAAELSWDYVERNCTFADKKAAEEFMADPRRVAYEIERAMIEGVPDDTEYEDYFMGP